MLLYCLHYSDVAFYRSEQNGTRVKQIQTATFIHCIILLLLIETKHWFLPFNTEMHHLLQTCYISRPCIFFFTVNFPLHTLFHSRTESDNDLSGHVDSLLVYHIHYHMQTKSHTISITLWQIYLVLLVTTGNSIMFRT